MPARTTNNGAACLPAAGEWRGTQRYEGIDRADEDALTRAIIALASEYGRYGYRRITMKLREAGGPEARIVCSGSGGERG